MRQTQRFGYTLVELLLSMALGLMILAAVIQMFSVMGNTINGSRSSLEMNEELCRTAALLRSDLEGITVIADPPRAPENGEGYLQIIEGPVGVEKGPETVSWDTDGDVARPDTTLGDIDDILLFTSRKEQGFRARKEKEVQKFDAAEVAWFVRGNKLYRKVLAIDTDPAMKSVPASDASDFFWKNDISVNMVTDSSGNVFYERNTLASLTRPDCRYGACWSSGFINNATPPSFPGSPYGLWHFAYPRTAGASSVWTEGDLPTLGLPLAAEIYYGGKTNPGPIWKAATAGDVGSLNGNFDPWRNPMPWNGVNVNDNVLMAVNGTLASAYSNDGASSDYVVDRGRVGEDLVLTNVLSFDVKVWDPQAPVRGVAVTLPIPPAVRGWGNNANQIGLGAYVDLGYLPSIENGTLRTDFSDVRLPSRNDAVATTYNVSNNLNTHPRMYDTWATHYEAELNAATGLTPGGVWKCSAPYMSKLRGIQVTLRVFDPDSRQIRQVTLEHRLRTS